MEAQLRCLYFVGNNRYCGGICTDTLAIGAAAMGGGGLLQALRERSVKTDNL